MGLERETEITQVSFLTKRHPKKRKFTDLTFMSRIEHLFVSGSEVTYYGLHFSKKKRNVPFHLVSRYYNPKQKKFQTKDLRD